MAGDRGGHAEERARDRRRDLAAGQVGAEGDACERVGEVLDDPQVAALEEQAVECAGDEPVDVDCGAVPGRGVDGEQRAKGGVVDDQRLAVPRRLDAVEARFARDTAVAGPLRASGSPDPSSPPGPIGTT